MRRIMLFLPGNNPNMIMNGGLLGADSIIFDLEDAVAPDQKDAARILVKSAPRSLGFGGCEIIIRMNALDTPYWGEDIEEVAPLGPSAIMPTKVSDGNYIRKLEQKITEIGEKNGMDVGEIKLTPLLETAMGIERTCDIVIASPWMEALYLGAEDLTADLKCERTKKGAEILYTRGRLVCAARTAGIEAYNTPFTDVEDMEGLRRDARFAKGLGYTGKAVINPRHVEDVNCIFSPSDKEIRYAREVFGAIREAKRQGKGAISLRGKMIDAPIAQRAKLIPKAASELEGVNYFE